MTELVILILAPGIRAGCLPFGEARGGGFALSEIPHPSRGLLLSVKVRLIFTSSNFPLAEISQNGHELPQAPGRCSRGHWREGDKAD